MRSLLLALIYVTALALSSCQREQRGFREPTAASTTTTGPTLSELRPGPKAPGEKPHGTEEVSVPNSPMNNPYENNAYAVAEGQKLYNAYNCVGCHANGGGGMGPPLMDAVWLYGSDPNNVRNSILEGRPNGMPAYRGKIPEQHVWQLVAYVRSLSGQLKKDVAPGRSDNMSIHKSPQQTPKESPQSPAGPEKAK